MSDINNNNKKNNYIIIIVCSIYYYIILYTTYDYFLLIRLPKNMSDNTVNTIKKLRPTNVRLTKLNYGKNGEYTRCGFFCSELKNN